MKGLLIPVIGWWIYLLKKNHKILIINNGLACGGIERASVSLANHWFELGFNVVLLSLYRSEHFYSLKQGIEFIEPEFSRRDINKYFYALFLIWFVRKQIKRIVPGTILAFGEWTNPYVAIANMGLPYPLYLTDRMNPTAKLPLVSLPLKRIFYKRVSGIIAQTNYAKETLNYTTKAKNITVINNPVNIVEKVELPPKNRIVTVGRLSAEKGHCFLIEAFAQLKNNDWELSIIGNGPEMAKLKKLAWKTGVADRVIFWGHLKDFSIQLSEAKIFVLPSLKEGFPNALIEAMSVPLACIATTFHDGKNEIIDDGINGLLIRPGVVCELVDKLNLLINDHILRENLASNAYSVREKFRFNKISEQYLQFILKLNA